MFMRCKQKNSNSPCPNQEVDKHDVKNQRNYFLTHRVPLHQHRTFGSIQVYELTAQTPIRFFINMLLLNVL